MVEASSLEEKMRTCNDRIVSLSTALALVFGLSLVVCLPDAAVAQVTPKPVNQETLEIGDEPGRISTEEVIITDGPYVRQVVFFRSNEAAGTLVIHTTERFAYLIQGNNRALRYGIGVGREGFQWSGLVRVSRKAEWPDWRPRRR